MLHNRPIVFLKKVALNFPPLEQGPTGKWVVGTCFSPQAAMLDFEQRPSKTLSAFESLASKKAKLLREANSENQFVARSLR
jgi:hypothetical protein